MVIAEDHATLTGTPTDRMTDVLSRFYCRLSTERRGWELLGLLIREGNRFPDLIGLNNVELVEPMLAEWKAILADGILTGEFGPQAAADHVPELVMAPAL